MKDTTELVKGKAGKICMGMRYACLLAVLLFLVSGCGNQKSSQEDNTQRNESVRQAGSGQETKESTGNEENKAASSSKILIAYFTLADNYENPEDMDATSQASINKENKELIGNTEYFAGAIQEETGGDLFSVGIRCRRQCLPFWRNMILLEKRLFHLPRMEVMEWEAVWKIYRNYVRVPML